MEPPCDPKLEKVVPGARNEECSKYKGLDGPELGPSALYVHLCRGAQKGPQRHPICILSNTQVNAIR